MASIFDDFLNDTTEQEGEVDAPATGPGIFDDFLGTAPATASAVKEDKAVEKPTTGTVTPDSMANAIRTVESGGDYEAKGASGEVGAYQFMPDTWDEWSNEYNKGKGRLETTQENQDAVAKHRISKWIDQGMTKEQIAAKWNSGSHKNWEDKKGTNKFGVDYDVPGYVKKIVAAHSGTTKTPKEVKSISEARQRAMGQGPSVMPDIVEESETDSLQSGTLAESKKGFWKTMVDNVKEFVSSDSPIITQPDGREQPQTEAQYIEDMKGTAKAVSGTYKYTDLGVEESRIWADKMDGVATDEQETRLQEIEQEKKTFEADLKESPIVLKQMAQLAPFYTQTMAAAGKGYLTGSLIFGLGTAILGNLGPQALIPEEAVTVPFMSHAGGKLVATLSGFNNMERIESGAAFKEMTDMGMEEDKARDAARIVGSGSGMMELLQIKLGMLSKIPGMKSFADGALTRAFGKVLSNKATAKTSARLFGGSQAEGVIEGGQQVWSNAVQMAAAEIEAEFDEKDLRANGWDEFKDRLTSGVGESYFTATVGSMGLGLPGASFQAGMNARTNTAPKQTNQPGVDLNIPAAGADISELDAAEANNSGRESVASLLGIGSKKKEGIHVSDGINLPDDMAAEIYGQDTTVQKVINKVATDKQLEKFDRDIANTEAEIQNLNEFYNNAVEEGDPNAALATARMVDEKVDQLSNTYVQLIEAANTKADMNNRMLNEEDLNSIDSRMQAMKAHSTKEVANQKNAVNAIQAQKNQVYLDNLGTEKGLKNELINANVDASAESGKTDKVATAVITELMKKEAVGNIAYMEKVSIDKLTKIKLDAQTAKLITQRNLKPGAIDPETGAQTISYADGSADVNKVARYESIMNWADEMLLSKSDVDLRDAQQKKSDQEFKDFQSGARLDARSESIEGRKAEAAAKAESVSRSQEKARADARIAETAENQRIAQESQEREAKASAAAQEKRDRLVAGAAKAKATADRVKTTEEKRSKAAELRARTISAKKAKEESALKAEIDKLKSKTRKPVAEDKTDEKEATEDSRQRKAAIKKQQADVEKGEKKHSMPKKVQVADLQNEKAEYVVVTPDHPQSKTVSDEANVKARKRFELKLRAMGIDFETTRSFFEGNPEQAYILKGATKAQGRKLSKELNQSSFLSASGRYIDLVDAKEGTRRILKTDAKINPTADVYTEIGGKRLSMPFFTEKEVDFDVDTVMPQESNTLKTKAKKLFKSAAMRLPNGKIYEGAAHPKIMMDNKAVEDYIINTPVAELSRGMMGFMTHDGQFVTREGASKLVGTDKLISEDFMADSKHEQMSKEMNADVADFSKMTLEGKMGALEVMDGLKQEMETGEYKWLFDRTKAGKTKTKFVTAPGQFGKLEEVKRTYLDMKSREAGINRFEGQQSMDAKGNMKRTGGTKGLYLPDQNTAIINIPSIGRSASNMKQARETAVHEHVHALAKIAMDNMTREEKNAFGKELQSWKDSIGDDKAWAEVRDNPANHPIVRMGATQVMESLNEIPTYALAHPEFAKFLDSKPASPKFRAMSKKIKTMWDALMHMVLKRDKKLGPTKRDEVVDILNRNLKLSKPKPSLPAGVRFDAFGEEGTTVPAGKIQATIVREDSPALGATMVIDPSKDIPAQVTAKEKQFTETRASIVRPGNALANYYRGKDGIWKKIKSVIPGLKPRDMLKESKKNEILVNKKRRKLGLPEIRYDLDSSFDFGSNVDTTKVADWALELDSIAENALQTMVVDDTAGMSKILGFEVPADVNAMWTEDGKLVINADKVNSKEKLTKLWMHEQVAHQGLRNVFGKNVGAFDRFLDQAYTLFSVKEAKDLFELIDTYDIGTVDAKGERKLNKKAKRLAAEEMIARRAEKLGTKTKRGLITRMKELIKRWLPKDFVLKKGDGKMPLSDKDIQNMLEAAHENVMTGNNKFGEMLDKAMAARETKYKFKPWKNSPNFMQSDRQYLDLMKRVLKEAPNMRKWYSEHVDTMRKAFGKDYDIFATLLAVTSPQAPVENNVAFAVETYAYMMGLKSKPGAMYPGALQSRIDNNWTSPENMLKDLESKQFKVTEFVRALLGDENATVGDVWMYRLFFGDPATTGKDAENYSIPQITAQRQKVHSLAAQMSKETGKTWTPREVQAALWVGVNSAQTGTAIKDIATFESGLNKPQEKFGGKSPLAWLKNLVPNLEEGPLSEQVGITNLELAPFSMLQKKVLRQKLTDEKGKYPVKKDGEIKLLKADKSHDSILKVVRSIEAGGRTLTAANPDMAEFYKSTFGFEAVAEGSLDMQLREDALELYTHPTYNKIRSSLIVDKLGGFSGNYNREVRFSKEVMGPLEETADMKKMDMMDADFLKTGNDGQSVTGKIHEWRDQSALNLDRFTSQKEQDFLSKFGGRKPKVGRSGRLLNTSKTRLLQKAMNLYIDSGNKMDTVDAYLQKLVDKGRLTNREKDQVDIIERMKAMSTEERAWADSEIRSYYDEFYEFANEAGLINSHVTDYVKRQWQMPKEFKDANVTWSGAATSGMQITPSSGKARTLDSIIDGWKLGMDLKTEGVIQNLQEYGTEIGYVNANRRFMQYMDGLISNFEDGTGLVTEVEAGKRGPEGFAKLDDRGFAVAGQEAWARKDLADELNKMGDRASHDFWNLPVVKGVRRINSMLKSTILSISMFHHLAGLRSYMFGVSGLGMQRFRPLKAYKEGLKKIDQRTGFSDAKYDHLGPIVDMLVKEGLTLGRQQDWDTSLQMESSVSNMLSKRTSVVSRKTLKTWEAAREWKQQWTHGLFGKLFAGLKAQSAAAELTHSIKKLEKEKGRGLTDSEMKTEAQRISRLINADFGGLHLSRMGRNPDLQKFFQTMALAPDWTESNWRTVSGMVPGLNKFVNKMIGDNPAPPGMGKTYRKFWAGIGIRAALTLPLAQLSMLALFANDDDWDEYKKQMSSAIPRSFQDEEFAKGRWASLDVTPMLRKFNQEARPGKRSYLNILGHFKDILKMFALGSLVKHKKSPLLGRAVDLATQTDWKGDRYKTASEFMEGVGNLDFSRVASGRLDQRDKPKAHEMQLLIGILDGAVGSLPIPLTNLMEAAFDPETTGSSALLRGLGVDIRESRVEDRNERLYWDKVQEVAKLDEKLKAARVHKDRDMIKEAKEDRKEYADGKFNRIKSRLGFTRAKLGGIKKKIQSLEAAREGKSLNDRQELKLKKLYKDRAKVFVDFAKVINR